MTAAERAIAERRAQGLPDRVEDPAVLARVATLVRYQQPSPDRARGAA